MNYELLEPGEAAQLAPIFRQFGADVPPFSTISMASENDKIAAFLCLQPVFHVEPLVVLPEYRGKVNVQNLYRKLMEALPKGTPHFAFVPNRQVALITGACGLQRLDWTIWRGEA
jgi:hypothetical protein